MSFDGIKVQHGHLDAGAADVMKAAKDIEARLDQLETELNPLRSDWNGNAKMAYDQAKAKWDQAMHRDDPPAPAGQPGRRLVQRRVQGRRPAGCRPLLSPPPVRGRSSLRGRPASGHFRAVSALSRAAGSTPTTMGAPPGDGAGRDIGGTCGHHQGRCRPDQGHLVVAAARGRAHEPVLRPLRHRGRRPGPEPPRHRHARGVGDPPGQLRRLPRRPEPARGVRARAPAHRSRTVAPRRARCGASPATSTRASASSRATTSSTASTSGAWRS